MKVLAALCTGTPERLPAVFAPAGHEPSLLAEIARLRAEGHRVVQALPGQSGGAREAACERELQAEGAGWRLASL